MSKKKKIIIIISVAVVLIAGIVAGALILPDVVQSKVPEDKLIDALMDEIDKL